jgi:general nucleoside transport system ATP-binding protein
VSELADPAQGDAGTVPRPGEPPLLTARGITKRFPGVVANAGVDLDLYRGEVHAVLGENGAGKSTLASILAGLYQPDAGALTLAGRPVALRSPREALAHGVGMVHQHFRLVRRFTVAENVALGDHSQPLVMSTPDVHRAVVELGERYGLPVRPDAVVADLTVGEQQRVEIVKTLYRGVGVLLLDEPTSVLTPQETEALFATVRAMARDDKAVVFISHKLGEVRAIADRITVMRDGRVVDTVRGTGSSVAALATLMVGREVSLDARRATAAPGPAVLELTGVGVDRDARRGRLSDVSLTVAAGEIVGVAGVSGNGQRPLAEVAAGLLAPDAGRVHVGGVDVTGRGPRAARAAGLGYVPEDRLGTGLAPSLSVADNLQLTRAHGPILRRARFAADARRLMQAFDIRAPGPDTVTSQLSGGNIQKVLLARELDAGPRVLVAASPTRGLDVGAIETVRALLAERRDDGCGILLISEDLDEIRALADRIVVLCDGRVTHRCDAEHADTTTLGLAMAGASP